jgi:DNA-binding transcriptional ArsR family regulator
MPQGKGPERKGPVKLAQALSHPERLRILMEMNGPVRRLSPNQYAMESGRPVDRTAYHFRVLRRAGFIEIVDERPRRGATEHYYEPVLRAMAWKREWEDLPPIVKQNIAAVSVRGYVEAVGAAIDAGLYDNRDESHISNDTFWTDALGFTEASRILDRALKELLDVSRKAKARLQRNPESEKFLASYGMSLFESAPKGLADEPS